ncbi:MAG: heavy metal translocating P-type ATPase [Anaerolineales bacterium]|nr:heavy metal translocating P-type ATPase [Anaerolineales bacterium]
MNKHTMEHDHSNHGGNENNQGHVGHQEEPHKGHGVDHTGHENMFRRKFWVSLVLSVPVILFSVTVQNWIGFSTPTFPGSNWIVPVISIVIFMYGGLPFIQMAIPEMKRRSPGMMSLITLAIVVAFLYSVASTILNFEESFYWELVTLIDVMLLGHWIEMRSVRQASGSLGELAKLIPDTAERINKDGSSERVNNKLLQIGDLLLIRPGESFPADGKVVEGQSNVNESMITGESKLVSKSKNDSVIAGTINDAGSLRVTVTATGDETALAGIMKLVKEAQQSKSNTQLLADKAAGWLFYIALAVAVLTGIGWTIAVGFNIEVIKRVTTVLVIACPHALGLAVPLVVAISTSLGAENGILVRDRIALEDARLVDTIIFDKTGTLTKGEFGISNISVMDGWTEDQALGIAAAIEGDSEHLIARAIQKKAQEGSINIPEISGFSAIKGKGVKAQLSGQDYFIGGPNLLVMLNIQPTGNIADFSDKAGKRGETVIYLVQDNHIAGAFSLADLIRQESAEAIAKLQEMGIETVMLTGDSQGVAQSVAGELGITRYYAEVLPEEKDKKVLDLQNEGKRVAMVGDCVNDAPALTRADVGIAIGSGTDVAIESAGIILVNNNPLDIVNIVNLSRATYRKMIQNLIWATGYNLVAIPLAAGVLAPFGILLSPAVGALFMSLSTIIVAFNAQLLRRGLL